MITVEYNRENAVEYAKRWALDRNPEYYDYSQIGGNCTNYVSQCVYAGSEVMNYTKDIGWYYIDANDKSPSWTGVKFFNNFMTQNNGIGPFGETTDLKNLELGDTIQFLNRRGELYHTVILTGITRTVRGKRYYVCANSRDAYQKNLNSYNFYGLSCIHILGVRKKQVPLN